MDFDDYLFTAVVVTAATRAVVFVACWIYCIATYGFLFGVGLGWLPAIITATIVSYPVGWLWPLALSLLGIAIVISIMLIAQAMGI